MKKILVSFIQDRSGSMASVWNETLNGFKTYVTDLQKDQLKDNEVEYLFSLTTFDTQIETPYLGVPIAKARLCRVSPGENYACSAGFFLSFTGSGEAAPEHNMFFTTYYLYDIL